MWALLALALTTGQAGSATPQASPPISAVDRGSSDGLSQAVRPNNCLDVRDYGAHADNDRDDIGPFIRATRAAIAQRKSLCISRGSYVLSQSWLLASPIDVFMEDSANLRFINPASCGIVIDLRGKDDNYGLNSIRLGGLYSPAVLPSFRFPGYPSSWRSDARSRCDAITLLGGSRIDISAKYLLGWNAGVRLSATQDPENGAKAPQNIDIQVNTADIVKYGLYLDAGGVDAGHMSAIDARFNTVFAKYPIYIDDRNNGISASSIQIAGQAFSNEEGGACLYDDGRNGRANTIDIHWCYAGFSAFDSPTGTDPSLTLPYVAGSTPSNGQINDGNATVGYFGSSNNRIRIGVAIDQRLTPGAAPPAAGRVTRVRDAGADNDIAMQFLPSNRDHPTMLSPIEGESRFMGGVGSAVIATRNIVKIHIETLKTGAEATYYYYNSLLSSSSRHLIQLVPYDARSASNGLTASAIDNSSKINRESFITLVNNSPSDIIGESYLYYIIVN